MCQNNNESIRLKRYSLVALHDADGSHEVDTSPRVGSSIGFVVKSSFSQKTSNSDLIGLVYEALGLKKNVTYTTRTEKTHESGEPIKESKGVFNHTSSEGQKLLSIFKEHPPLAPAKRRDFLIASKVFDFKERCVCDELSYPSTSYPLVKDGITINFSEVSSLNTEAKEKVSSIAMIFLKYHNAQSYRYSLVEQEARNIQMYNTFKTLNCTDFEESLGVRLAQYYLVDINNEQAQLNNELTSTNYQLPNDYIIGMFLGDGWFSIYIKASEKKIKVVPAFSIIQSSDCTSLLQAFKHTFDNKGFITPDSPTKTAYVYKLEGIKNCLKYIIPLFDEYQLSSTKQKQYDLFKNILLKLQRKEHLTRTGFEDILDLAYEFSFTSQGTRKYTKEEHKAGAQFYFDK